MPARRLFTDPTLNPWEGLHFHHADYLTKYLRDTYLIFRFKPKILASVDFWADQIRYGLELRYEVPDGDLEWYVEEAMRFFKPHVRAAKAGKKLLQRAGNQGQQVETHQHGRTDSVVTNFQRASSCPQLRANWKFGEEEDLGAEEDFSMPNEGSGVEWRNAEGEVVMEESEQAASGAAVIEHWIESLTL
jgi:hypothetical protein